MAKNELGLGVAGFSLSTTLLAALVKTGKLTKNQAVEIIKLSRVITQRPEIFPGDSEVLSLADFALKTIETDLLSESPS